MDASAEQLESTLKQLATIGELLDDDGERQRWRFQHAGRELRLHFYPKQKLLFRRLGRTRSAMSEFVRLQMLQKANVPSPRAHSVMLGFRLNDKLGDALILEGAVDDRTMDQVFFELNGSPGFGPQRRSYLKQLVEILHRLARAGLGHRSMRMRRFSIANGQLLLADARGVCRGGLRLKQLFELAHDARGVLTRGDVVRVWHAVGTDRPPPQQNSLARRLWRRFDDSTLGENEHFGRIIVNDWRGVFTRRAPQPYNWSNAAAIRPRCEDWVSALPGIFEKLASNSFEILKRDESGDVFTGTIQLANRSVDIVIKRPLPKYWWRRITQIVRGSRSHRNWTKTWRLLIRNIPTEYPLVLLERRKYGYSVESLFIAERVPGPTLAAVNLNQFSADGREALFVETGQILRRIDDLGFMHADAKSTNWIVREASGPHPARPILIDADGVRHYRWAMLGLNRLLRAMKQHPQYTPDDSKLLCLGYAPEARVVRDS